MAKIIKIKELNKKEIINILVNLISSPKFWIILSIIFAIAIVLLSPGLIDFIESKGLIIGKVVVQTEIIGSFAPTFDESLTDQTIEEGSLFVYDINCSDQDLLDTVYYYDNSTFFEISVSTGILSWTPNQSNVGSNSFLITCSDGSNSSSGTLNVLVVDVNMPPVLSSIGTKSATESTPFSIDIDATDPDGDTLTYYSNNSALFTINSSNGYVNFTPTLAQVGIYTINFSVYDGSLYDSEAITLTIYRGPYCGDTGCSGLEDCSNCAADCGSCPTAGTGTGTTSGTGTGGSGGGGTVTTITGRYVCIEKWSCTRWSDCSISGIQSRKCFDLYQCGTTYRKPAETNGCVYLPTCYDGVQNGAETGVDCGANCAACPLIKASCYDGIKNQNEQDVDCGGPCTSCTDKKFARLPSLEAAKLFEIIYRQFPWLLVLIITLLLILLLSSDQIYVNYIKKSEFKEYRTKYRRYKPFRLKLYKFIVHALALTFVTSFYIYFVSDDWSKFFKYLWILIILLVVAPTIVAFIFMKLEYSEHRKLKKEEKERQTHLIEKRNLISIEDKNLLELENLFLLKADSLLSNSEIADAKILRENLEKLKAHVAHINENRKDKVVPLAISDETIKEIDGLAVDQYLMFMAKEYPEFGDTLTTLKSLGIAIKKKQNLTVVQFDYIADIKDIAKDRHLMVVCSSEKHLVELYNSLVDIYLVFNNYLQSQDMLDQQLIQKEQKFVAEMDQASSNAEFTEAVSKDAKSVEAYNLLVDLLNQYKKRIDLVSQSSG